jgi:hypothetical protein
VICGRRGTLALAVKESSDFAIARRWLSAVRTGKTDQLASLTALPFTFGTTARNKRCEGPVKTAEALASWRKCVREAQEAFFSEVDAVGDTALQEGGGADSKALRALVKKAPPGGAWIRAAFKGDGVTYALRFLVLSDAEGAGRVSAFLLDAQFETG